MKNERIEDMKYTPGAYWFGVSYESDMRFSERLYGKTKDKFISAVNKAWGKL